MNDNTTHRTTLVLGGTGKTGRRVVERLEARGLPVRVGSRSPGRSNPAAVPAGYFVPAFFFIISGSCAFSASSFGRSL